MWHARFVDWTLIIYVIFKYGIAGCYTVSLKCIKIQQAANLHRIKSVHLVEEDPAPLLLAYIPFYHKSEYMTREGRIVKQVREEAQKDKAAAKAREDLLLQKQLELEAALKRQEALIAQLMNKQA